MLLDNDEVAVVVLKDIHINEVITFNDSINIVELVLDYSSLVTLFICERFIVRITIELSIDELLTCLELFLYLLDLC